MQKSSSEDGTHKEKFTEVTKQEELAQKVADAHDNILSPKQIIIVFAAMATALFLSFVDQTSITVALPHIAKDLGAEKTISWAGTSSLISNTVFMVLFGRFSDIFSRKYTMIACMIILAFSDLACGLAQTPTQLYVFRGFCGIGNGGITSLTTVIVSDIVTLEQRGKFQGILGTCVGLGNAIGPFIASGFIQHQTWRKMYFTLFAIIPLATLIIYFIVPYTKPVGNMEEKIKNVDYGGFLLSSIGIIFILIPVSGGGSSFEWNSALVVAMLTIGSISVVCFIIFEIKFARLPLIPIKLFYTNISLSLILSQNLFFGICYYSAVYYYPYYFEVIRDYSVTLSSCYLLALVLPQSIISITGGQVISRTKHYWHVVLFGYSSWIVAMGLLNLWTVDVRKGVNVGTLVLNGLGVGCIFQPTLVAAQAHSFKRDRAIIISTRNVLRSFGGAVGLAISSTVIANTFLKNLRLTGSQHFNKEQLDYLKTQLYSRVDLSQYSLEQSEYLKSIYMDSLKKIFYIWMGCIAFCFVTNLFIKDKGLKPLDG